MKRYITIVTAFNAFALNAEALADQKTFDLMAPIASEMTACERQLTPKFQRIFGRAFLDVPEALEQIKAYDAISLIKIIEMDSEKRNKYCSILEKAVKDTWGK